MASGSIKAKYKKVNIQFTLSEKVWSQSYGGMYYLNQGNSVEIANANEILSIMIADFSNLRASDILLPFLLDSKHVSLMSSRNAFTNEGLVLKVIYI